MTQTNVALFDLDGTDIRETLEVSLSHHLVSAGVVPASAFAKSHKIQHDWKRRDSTYEEFTDAHWREVAAALKGLSVDVVRDVARKMIAEIGWNVHLFTREFRKALKECDYKIVAISGTNQETAEIFGDAHGYDRVIGTQYTRENDVFVGGVTYWPGEGGKREIAKQILAEYNASPERSVGIGDTVNDFGMLQSVRYPIAFNATRALEKLVRESSGEWSRNIGMVTERKDRLRIEQFFPDMRSRMQARECSLRQILPADVAKALSERLGEMCMYDDS